LSIKIVIKPQLQYCLGTHIKAGEEPLVYQSLIMKQSEQKQNEFATDQIGLVMAHLFLTLFATSPKVAQRGRAIPADKKFHQTAYSSITGR
jgi:hypothetical protein